MVKESYTAGWEFDAYANGTLYRNQSDERADAAVALLDRLLADEDEIATLERLDTEAKGGMAEVRAAGDIAIKLFHDTPFARWSNISGVPYLMASIALQVGISRLGDLAAFTRKGNTYKVQAPTMYAHYIANDRPPISFMERMPGSPMASSRAIEPRLRRICNTALWMVDVDPGRVFLDTAGKNVLKAQTAPNQFTLSRLDIVAR